MSEITKVDARGLSCPQPVLETKRAAERAEGGELIVLVDTVTSRWNVMRFAENAGWKAESREVQDYYEVRLVRPPAAN